MIADGIDERCELAPCISTVAREGLGVRPLCNVLLFTGAICADQSG